MTFHLWIVIFFCNFATSSINICTRRYFRSKNKHNMQTLCHLSILAHEQAKIYGNREAFVYKDFGGTTWKSCSWNQFSNYVKAVSNALVELEVGIQENIAVFSQNSLQYAMVDFGAWGVRAVTVPFYATTSEEQVQFMINDAKIRYIFCGEQEQYDKARRVMTQCPTLEKIIVFDSNVRLSSHDPNSIYFGQFLKMGADMKHAEEVQKRSSEATNEELANILYTSGTTGVSKGVMLTHGQYTAAFLDNHNALPLSPKDRVLNFLPFTHIFEKGWALLCVTEGCTLIINTVPGEVQETMRQTHPTCMSAVPRFWEKVYAGVKAKIDGAEGMQKKIFEEALKIGHAHNVEYLAKGKRPPLWLQMKYQAINKTIFSLIRKQLGLTNPNIFPTAGSFIAPDVQEFILSIGIFMLAGYGLTESLATVSCVHKDKPFNIGSIGRPIESIDIKFSDEGEILLKGPTITKGYYNRPDLNSETFTEDGYFRTGDAGYMKDGELYITERIKDLFKTSNGKYIAPQPIEAKILVDKFVEQVSIIADQRKYVSALIVPAFNQLEKWANENGIQYADREELCKDERVNKMIMERIDTLQQSLAHYEKIKRFTLMPHHFSLERGEITNTLKIKRRVLLENYADIIEKMYEE